MLECRFRVFSDDRSVFVECTPGSGAPKTYPLQLDLAEKSRLRDVLARIGARRCDRSDLQDAGSQLWAALCPLSMRRAFIALRDSEAEPLRVTLDVQVHELTTLPWECIHDELGDGFIAAD